MTLKTPAVAPPTKSEHVAKRPLRSSLARFRRALEEQRDAQIARLAAIDGTAYVSHRSAGDEHLMVARIEAMRRLIVDTENALMRIDNDTYGTCQRCRQDIPVARLEILPHASLCVGCQQHQDSRAA